MYRRLGRLQRWGQPAQTRFLAVSGGGRLSDGTCPNTLRPMLYRFIRGLNEIYGVTVMFCFIAAFFIAFAFTLIYPIVPLVMLISSIFLVVIARGVFLILRWIERGVAKSALGRGNCPACATKVDAILVGERRVHECPGCRRIFDDVGDPYVPQENPEDAQKTATFERSTLGAA